MLNVAMYCEFNGASVPNTRVAKCALGVSRRDLIETQRMEYRDEQLVRNSEVGIMPSFSLLLRENGERGNRYAIHITLEIWSRTLGMICV